MTSTMRLDGVDFARFLAFVGMVLVNFTVAMGVDGGLGAPGSTISTVIVGALEGRAAATFVVLAGLGMGLAVIRQPQADHLFLTSKRALFLFIIGLLNSLIFDADILHYYALYFFFGVFFIRVNTAGLIFSIFALMTCFVIMLVTLDYDLGWDWKTYTYKSFWTLEGFVCNLFFNGWHPVIPWLSFFLFGLILSRLSLHRGSTQLQLFIYGLLALLTVEGLSYLALLSLEGADQDLLDIATTEPIPPMPFYMIAGMGTAAMVLAFSLCLDRYCNRSALYTLCLKIGRQSLTLYVAHILIGMSALELLGLLAGQGATSSIDHAVLASGLFILGTAIYIWAYSKFFTRGPIEYIMRRVTG